MLPIVSLEPLRLVHPRLRAIVVLRLQTGRHLVLRVELLVTEVAKPVLLGFKLHLALVQLLLEILS